MDFCFQLFFVNSVKKLVLQSTLTSVNVFKYSFDRAIIIIVIMF